MLKKQQEMKESVDRARQEANEKKQKERIKAAKETNRAARGGSDDYDEQSEQFRSVVKFMLAILTC